MRIIHAPVDIVQKELQTWDIPFVERDCFGTDNAEQIAGIIDEFCRSYLSSGLRGYFFYRASVGSTHGVQLEDSRNIVIKVRPPPETNPALSFDRKSLDTICAVMNWLADRNFPCPKILLVLKMRIFRNILFTGSLVPIRVIMATYFQISPAPLFQRGVLLPLPKGGREGFFVAEFMNRSTRASRDRRSPGSLP